MAKAENGKSINKSQAIRDVFAESPSADTQTVIARVAERGVKVTPTMVYFVRSKLNQARRKERRDRVAESSRQTSASDPVEVVRRVKELAREVGGIEHLKRLVDLLAE